MSLDQLEKCSLSTSKNRKVQLVNVDHRHCLLTSNIIAGLFQLLGHRVTLIKLGFMEALTKCLGLSCRTAFLTKKCKSYIHFNMDPLNFNKKLCSLISARRAHRFAQGRGRQPPTQREELTLWQTTPIKFNKISHPLLIIFTLKSR